MESNLAETAKQGDIDALYALLPQWKNVLDWVDEQSFYDTPLHLAASYGHIEYALEIMLLKPSFATKLDVAGHSPLHLALRNGHFKTAKKLATAFPKLIRVKGRGGITPLLYLAATGSNDKLLTTFLLLNPMSINDLSAGRGQSVVHLAVANQNESAFHLIFGWLQRTDNEKILNWKDNEGNRALHIAVSTSQLKVVKLLVSGTIYVHGKNKNGQTALDIATALPNEEIKKVLVESGCVLAVNLPQGRVGVIDFLKSPRRLILETLHGIDIYLSEGLTSEMRNALLVVAGLIATATYQAILQPPGGYHVSKAKKVHHKALDIGSFAPSGLKIQFSLLGGCGYASSYLFLNTLAFSTSVAVLDLLFPLTRYDVLLKLSLNCLVFNYHICAIIAASSSTLNVFLVYFASFPMIMVIITWISQIANALVRWQRRYIMRFPVAVANGKGQLRAFGRHVGFMEISRSVLVMYLSRLNS